MSALLHELDQCRVGLLRLTLRFDPARKIFVSRALRLSFFLALCFLVNFFLALSVPVLMLALGPLFFGITHLFSSFRFIPQAITADKSKHGRASRMIGMTVLAAGAARILQLKGVPIPGSPGLADGWEWLALTAAFSGLAYFLRLDRKTAAVSVLTLLPLLICSWNYPLATAAALMVGHNFVPFFYWMKMAKSRGELAIAVIGLGAFTLVHAVILAGLTDGLAHQLAFDGVALGSSFNPLTIAQQIFPASTDFTLLERALSVFAFGQAVHYFLWIKVIPEEAIRQEVPLTFKQSRRAIENDLGISLTRFAVLSAIGIVGMLIFVEAGVLRDIYVAGAAAHGYAEIAGLPFLLFRRS